MARKCNGRWLLTMIAAAVVSVLGPFTARGQPATTWDEKLKGIWCDAEHGCTHWWTLYKVEVRADRITVLYAGTRLTIFKGKIQEPVGRWMLAGNLIKPDGTKGDEFKAAVSELEGVKETIEGKFKGSLKAKIETAEIEGIKFQKIEGITISEASIDEATIKGAKIEGSKMGRATIEEATIKGAKIEGAAIEGAKSEGSKLEAATIKGDKLEGREIEGKKIEAETIAGKRIEGKIEGKKIEGKRIEGGRQVEISIPIQISEATIEGSTKPKAKRGDGGDDDADEMDEKKKIEMKGKIRGKITTSTGEGSLNGDFEGVFTALVQARISGVYSVPPQQCSGAGPRSREQLERKAGRKKAEGMLAKFGIYRSSEEVKEWNARKDVASALVAEAGKTSAARPAEPGTQGRFTRQVKGTVSVIAPPTITLELPPLPVLDHKCSVVQELPKRVLKLIKQHDL